MLDLYNQINMMFQKILHFWEMCISMAIVHNRRPFTSTFWWPLTSLVLVAYMVGHLEAYLPPEDRGKELQLNPWNQRRRLSDWLSGGFSF